MTDQVEKAKMAWVYVDINIEKLLEENAKPVTAGEIAPIMRANGFKATVDGTGLGFYQVTLMAMGEGQPLKKCKFQCSSCKQEDLPLNLRNLSQPSNG